MKALIPAVAAIAIAMSPALARAQGEVVAGQTTITLPDTQAYSPAARRIVALEVGRSAAIARHDTTWLATLYAPDFRGVVANGRRVSRDDLFRVFSFDNPAARFAIDELEVRDFGEAATVTGRLRTLGAGESRYLHVYVRRDGRWWLVAAEGTAVPPAS